MTPRAAIRAVPARAGTILIIVAGISALLASLAVAFMLRVRQGADTTEAVLLEAQARLMLHAACAYVLESSRLGYGPSRERALAAADDGDGFVRTGDGRLAVREGFGWIDVREADGGAFPDPAQPGPRDQNGRLVYSPGRWPAVGGVVICPMQRWTRPPYAIRPTVAYNPILIDPAHAGETAWGRPLLLNPDPQPAVANGWPGAVGTGGWSGFVRGDPAPVANSVGLSWFRIMRRSAATFIVCCGAGGSMGFKDWDEVTAWRTLAGAPDGPELFNHDPTFFAALQSTEVKLFYEIRWSAAVRPLDFRNEEALWWRWLQNAFAYRIYPMNGTQYTGWCRTNRYNPNPVGTISYIQRLEARGGDPIDPQTGSHIAGW
jgi:hypothetical protein